jgi:hypothetical protein
MLHSIASRLHMTVGRLLEEASSRELHDWVAFFAIEAEPDAEADDAASFAMAQVKAAQAAKGL